MLGDRIMERVRDSLVKFCRSHYEGKYTGKIERKF